jgi:hypothetical protein
MPNWIVSPSIGVGSWQLGLNESNNPNVHIVGVCVNHRWHSLYVALYVHGFVRWSWLGTDTLHIVWFFPHFLCQLQSHYMLCFLRLQIEWWWWRKIYWSWDWYHLGFPTQRTSAKLCLFVFIELKHILHCLCANSQENTLNLNPKPIL